MNIGSYLNYVLHGENIDKKSLYDKVQALMESTGDTYVTYSRFCNKLNGEALSAKEFIYIASILGERFDCNKFIQTVVLELPTTQDVLSPKFDDNTSKLRDQLDFWYDYEILLLNTPELDFYKTIPHVKLLDQDKSKINVVARYIDNSDEPEEKKGVVSVHYFSYSFETDELRFEHVDFGKHFTDNSHSPVPHLTGEKGHGRYVELFYTDKLTSYLKLNDMTCEDFEKLCLADKMSHVDEWLGTRLTLTGKSLDKTLEFDI